MFPAFLLFGILASATTVDVRLFSTAAITQTWISTYNADHYLIALNQNFEIIDTVADLVEKAGTNRLVVTLSNKRVQVKQGESNYGEFAGLLVVAKTSKGHFLIKGKGRERIYSGSLILRPRTADMLVVNRVPLEDYVAGVVESEGGHHAQFEYFKAQAVLARTWVLKNMNKHLDEGYNVKDDVTSQAYYSKAYLQFSDNILRAVKETRDTILVDQAGNPIFGAFHSNSGGQTANSEDAWSGKISYLRSVEDSFSLKMEKAYWEKTISKTSFVSYFATKLEQSATDAEFVKAILSFKQPTRQAYFTYKGKSLKLRYVRQKFDLRSTFFSVYDQGDNVLLKGRGFGHGVGMSQEGAMRMAELGYCYKDILKFYFKNVQFSNINGKSF